MKIGRAIGSILAIVLFCIGIGVYTLHNALKDVVSDQIIDSTIDQIISTAITSNTDTVMGYIPEGIKDQLPEELIDNLPEEVESKFESVKEDIVKDPQVQALTQKYMDAILLGSTDENAEIPNVNQDIENIIESNLPKIAEATGTEYTQTQIEAIAKEVTNKVDAQSLFNKGMDMVRNEITPQQQKMLSSLNFLQSSNCIMLSFSFIAMAIVIVALIKKSFYKWMPMIGISSAIMGGIILICAIFAKTFVEKLMQGLPSIFGSAGVGIVESIAQSGIYIFGYGLVLILMYLIIRFITNRVVYE